MTWKQLRAAINDRLRPLGIPEDKFVGPYFLSKTRLKNPRLVAEDLWGYLWNDVLKTRASDFFQEIPTLAELLIIWQDGQGSPIGDL
ncbi:MAG: hypothetical protein AMXMBFR67_19950 [Nitrospira sp.]